jgi:hypothetical protein
LWRRVKKQPAPLHSHVYQNVAVALPFRRLHANPFSDTHERYARTNKQIAGDTDVTRMRTYLATAMGRLALSSTTLGTFATAGVSFGVAPKVMADLLDFRATGRPWVMIDPLDGRGDELYNTSLKVAQDGWDSQIPTSWIQSSLLDALTLPSDDEGGRRLGQIAFLHLNTGDFWSEYSALDDLWSRVVP